MFCKNEWWRKKLRDIMDLTGQSEGGDVYFGMAFFLSLPFIFFLSFLIFRSRFYLSEEFSHFHMSAFSFLSQSCQSPSTESQLSPLKYAFRDPHGCFHSSFIFPLSDLVLLNDTVCFL